MREHGGSKVDCLEGENNSASIVKWSSRTFFFSAQYNAMLLFRVDTCVIYGVYGLTLKAHTFRRSTMRERCCPKIYYPSAYRLSSSLCSRRCAMFSLLPADTVYAAVCSVALLASELCSERARSRRRSSRQHSTM